MSPQTKKQESTYEDLPFGRPRTIIRFWLPPPRGIELSMVCRVGRGLESGFDSLALGRPTYESNNRLRSLLNFGCGWWVEVGGWWWSKGILECQTLDSRR